MWRMARRAICLAVVGAIGTTATPVWAVDPNPLESAYWRFEEGEEFGRVEPRNEPVVLDSINENHMQAFMDANVDASPTYTSNVPTKPLKSGVPNTLALDFLPSPNGQDLHTSLQNINNGIIEPGGGFTVEAAFNTFNPARWAAIIAKEGRPGQGDPDFFLDNLPTFALKTREDNSHLGVELFDAAGNFQSVASLEPVQAGIWYYVAVVNDGTELSLWLDSDAGSGYELQGTTPVDGALYQGGDPHIDGDFNGDFSVSAADYTVWRDAEDADQADYELWRANFGAQFDGWNRNWTIGRGQFAGAPTDWFDGIIDEVRITNHALEPSDFLFAPADPSVVSFASGAVVPEPSGIVLALLALAGLVAGGGAGRRRTL